MLVTCATTATMAACLPPEHARNNYWGDDEAKTSGDLTLTNPLLDWVCPFKQVTETEECISCCGGTDCSAPDDRPCASAGRAAGSAHRAPRAGAAAGGGRQAVGLD